MKKIVLAICLTSLMGCSAKSLNEGANQVRVMTVAPEGCTFIGEVSGAQGNYFTADLTTDKNIILGARNEMRNQAHSLGANVVVIEKTVDNSNDGLDLFVTSNSAGLSSSKGTYSSTLIGQAFYCAD